MVDTNHEASARVTLTRKQLYDLVWQESMASLSTKYQISDVGIAKICKRYTIPVPPVGYWRRKETGYATRQPPLRPAKADEVGIVSLTPRQPLGEAELARRAAENDIGVVVVPQSFEAAAPLHLLTKRSHTLLGSRSSPAAWRTFKDGQWCHDIDVFPETLERALLLMDTIVKQLEQQGLPVRCGLPRPARKPRRYEQSNERIPTSGAKTVIAVGDMDVCLAIRERRIKPRPSTGGKGRFGVDTGYSLEDFTGSGELSVFVPDHVGGWSPKHKWVDKPRLRVEDRVAEIVSTIPVVAQENRDIVAGWEQAEKDAEARAAEEYELSRARAKLKARREAYEAQLFDWQRALSLADLLSAARERPEFLANAAKHLELTPEEWESGLEDFITQMNPFTKEYVRKVQAW